MKQIENQPSGPQGTMRRLERRVLDEFRKYIVITIYLWVLFALLADYKRILLQENGINLWNQGYALFNALIFGKVILIGQALKIGEGLKDQALIWSVFWKSLLFTILICVFHIAEEAVKALIQHRPVGVSLAEFGGATWAGFLVHAALLMVALIPLFAFEEVAREVGRNVLWDLLFSRDRSSWRQRI
ncbi:hypothetical protein [Aestuariivirga sp.]|uniref:hypothetical protein n=1 Tax=Aestuariivirga sp. TaxID=2650926 RepID=UPI0037840AD2